MHAGRREATTSARTVPGPGRAFNRSRTGPMRGDGYAPMGAGETDRTVYFTYVKVWDAGEHHGAYRFELARADESVLEWL